MKNSRPDLCTVLRTYIWELTWDSGSLFLLEMELGSQVRLYDVTIDARGTYLLNSPVCGPVIKKQGIYGRFWVVEMFGELNKYSHAKLSKGGYLCRKEMTPCRALVMPSFAAPQCSTLICPG